MDIQVSSNFERVLFEAYRRDASAMRALMGSLAQSQAASPSPATRSSQCATAVHRRPRRRRGSRRHHARRMPGGAAIASIRTPRSASPSPRRKRATRRCRWSCCRPRTRPNSPTRFKPPAATPEAARLAGRPAVAQGARHRAAGRTGGGRKICRFGVPRGARRRCGVRRRNGRRSHQLPSGLTVVTDRMPHLESASLGVWVGLRQPRREARRARHLASPRAYGVQGHQAAQRARARRRRSKPSAATSMPAPASRPPPITPVFSRPTCHSRSMCCPTSSPIRASPRTSSSVSRTSSCRRSARSRTRRTIWCSSVSTKPRSRISRSAAQSSVRPRRCARFDPDKLRHYLTRNYRGPDMIVAAAGAVDHKDVLAQVEEKFASFTGPAAPIPQAANSAAAPASRSRDLEQVHLALACRACRSAIRSFTACRFSPPCSAAACHRGCSRRCVRSAAFATRSTPSTCRTAIPACSASIPAPTSPTRLS